MSRDHSSARIGVIFAFAVMLGGMGLSAQAGLLPNPANPTPIPNGYTNQSAAFTVNVTPSPAVFIPQGNCPWLLPGLSAEGFVKPQGLGYVGTNGWTVNFATLAGTLTMNSYYPYVTKAPAITLNGGDGTVKVPATNEAGFGGAVMNLSYTPGRGDPTGNQAEWIQVVKTNYAFANDDPQKQFGFNAGGGFTYFIDDFYPGNTPANNGTMNPTYDGGYDADNDPKGFAATSTNFVDVPSIPLSNGLDAEFQVFLAKDNVATKTLTIYDGVWWGFQATANAPEPGSTMLMLGCVIFLCARVRPSRRHPRAAA